MGKSPITSPLSDADKASVGAVLQATLVDLIDLSLAAKQAHWNVVGKNFRSVHLQLDELVTMARTYTDEVAERASALGISPNGKARTVAETSGVPDFPENWLKEDEVVSAVVAALAALIERLRSRVDETDKSDLVTQDLMIEITKQLEQAHWMWQAQQA
ncbi:Dps family protein [Saccharothrix algeriensis]|uniref:DNA starvation/stationary phase protection protein n=1 Tax=Saccharothrix algeriensis TaxID=173560 RepID=A0A8T8I4T7_9PSEU|nr:DNA starvation/stationary phase protection protein [Saccharothrix algeriensis]MBM7811938.1 starvation-inducible DNA-binding protein [Saccharothrix algeriensis]QTR05641.1 DNA starvation/stationary phase protection protein [Saccharothrix algeriensis]